MPSQTSTTLLTIQRADGTMGWSHTSSNTRCNSMRDCLCNRPKRVNTMGRVQGGRLGPLCVALPP
eukprot:scaffold968_cov209-Pinguiococcus_pyrenoidosus.AAC.1